MKQPEEVVRSVQMEGLLWGACELPIDRFAFLPYPLHDLVWYIILIDVLVPFCDSKIVFGRLWDQEVADHARHC